MRATQNPAGHDTAGAARPSCARRSCQANRDGGRVTLPGSRHDRRGGRQHTVQYRSCLPRQRRWAKSSSWSALSTRPAGRHRPQSWRARRAMRPNWTRWSANWPRRVRELQGTIAQPRNRPTRNRTRSTRKRCRCSQEYQSTNEELLTSKEELQSLNEELTALNSQLQETLDRQRITVERPAERAVQHQCRDGIPGSCLKIRFFTPATRVLFNVIPGDIGRPLADLTFCADDGGCWRTRARAADAGADGARNQNQRRQLVHAADIAIPHAGRRR